MSTKHHPYPAQRPRSKLLEFISRHTLLLAMLCLVGVWTWQSLTPQQLFATEEARVEFLKSVGEPPSTRIITLVTEWCPACKQLEHQLTEDNIPHLALDIEHNPVGAELFKKVYAVTKSNSIPQIILDRDIVSRAKLFLAYPRTTGTAKLPPR
jgi:glutaredoxin